MGWDESLGLRLPGQHVRQAATSPVLPLPRRLPAPRLPGARKRMAVPYRAANTPAERSEFAQPDVALLLTHLSYYR